MFAWENCFYSLCLTFEESSEFTCTAIEKGFLPKCKAALLRTMNKDFTS